MNPHKYNWSIKLYPWLAKIISLLIPYKISHRIIVVCRGYNEDDLNFTELVWADDKCLDFYDRECYPEFQAWVRLL
jgi:hypothetical protein